MFDPIVSVNGVLGAGISPLDRGFNYGDGLFETIRLTVSNSEPRLPLWHLHRQRLLCDCARLGIVLSEAKLQGFVEQILVEARAQNIAAAIVKIVVTRGVGGRGYLPPADAEPTICVGLYPAPAHPAEHGLVGIGLHLCSQVLSASGQLAGIKHLNKLEYVLARAEWRDSSAAEGLLLDASGCVVEGTFSNVFWLKDGVLFTPQLDQCGVAGVMRRLIMTQLAPKLGLQVQEKAVPLDDLKATDEVFMCNSVCGIWPVLSLAGCRWKKGVMTEALQAGLDAHLEGLLQ